MVSMRLRLGLPSGDPTTTRTLPLPTACVTRCHRPPGIVTRQVTRAATQLRGFCEKAPLHWSKCGSVPAQRSPRTVQLKLDQAPTEALPPL
jgi:hypothetical protein